MGGVDAWGGGLNERGRAFTYPPALDTHTSPYQTAHRCLPFPGQHTTRASAPPGTAAQAFRALSRRAAAAASSSSGVMVSVEKGGINTAQGRGRAAGATEEHPEQEGEERDAEPGEEARNHAG